MAAAQDLLGLIVGGLGQHVVVNQRREPAIGASLVFRQASNAARPSCLAPSARLEERLAPGL